jgi:hypothetical protein
METWVLKTIPGALVRWVARASTIIDQSQRLTLPRWYSRWNRGGGGMVMAMLSLEKIRW